MCVCVCVCVLGVGKVTCKRRYYEKLGMRVEIRVGVRFMVHNGLEKV